MSSISLTQQPQTDESYRIVVSSPDHIDRILREEELFIKKMVAQLKQARIGMVLLQESVLNTAVSPLAKHWLAKTKIAYVVLPRTELEVESNHTLCLTSTARFWSVEFDDLDRS